MEKATSTNTCTSRRGCGGGIRIGNEISKIF